MVNPEFFKRLNRIRRWTGGVIFVLVFGIELYRFRDQLPEDWVLMAIETVVVAAVLTIICLPFTLMWLRITGPKASDEQAKPTSPPPASD